MKSPDIERFVAAMNGLLSEPMDSTFRREQTEFDRLVHPFENAFVLFGAGNLGRMIRAKLHSLGIEPLAFTDNNPKLWGSIIDGIPVLCPLDAASQFGSSAAFLVAIWGVGSRDRMATRVRQLRELGCHNVIPFLPLFWKYPDLFLPYHVIDQPHKVRQEADLVQAAWQLWADEFSRCEYVAQVKWRLWGDFNSMADPAPQTIYFPQDLFTLGPREVFVDCGAFNGDTVACFLGAVGSQFDKIFAFEPDPANFSSLRCFIAALEPAVRERIFARQNAIGAAPGKVRFSALGSDGSALDANGETEVDGVCLDEVLPGDTSPTHIKMDIEGAELDALLGSRAVIGRHAPILAICSYHRQSDLWRIPLLIHSINPDYRLYLRPHLIEGWDVVCYAVPPKRAAG